jgi:hypothetical protein
MEPIYLVSNWEISLKEQGANHIIYGVKSMLTFIILRRGVGAGHLQNDTTSGGECSRGGIVELMVIVALKNFDGATKLCGDKGEKI